MSESILTFTNDSFNALEGKVLVDFWAPWCGPCRMMAPELEKVKAHYGSALTVAKLNIDENEDAAVRFGVSSIPTLLLFQNGGEIGRFVGAQPAPKLVQAIDSALAGAKSVG